MEENPHLKKRDKGGFDCEVSRCHRLEFLNELLSHDPMSNFINDRAHFKADSKSLEILTLDSHCLRLPGIGLSGEFAKTEGDFLVLYKLTIVISVFTAIKYWYAACVSPPGKLFQSEFPFGALNMKTDEQQEGPAT